MIPMLKTIVKGTMTKMILVYLNTFFYWLMTPVVLIV